MSESVVVSGSAGFIGGYVVGKYRTLDRMWGYILKSLDGPISEDALEYSRKIKRLLDKL